MTVNTLCRAGLPVDANPLVAMISMSRQFERGRLWRFVCCCLAAFMSLSGSFLSYLEYFWNNFEAETLETQSRVLKTRILA